MLGLPVLGPHVIQCQPALTVIVVYCSPACRVKAHRLRQEAALRNQGEDDEEEEPENVLSEEDENEDVPPEEEDEPQAAGGSYLRTPPAWVPPIRKAIPLPPEEEEEEEDEEDDWELQRAQREQARLLAEQQEIAQALHREYMRIIEQLLEWEGIKLAVPQLSRYFDKISRALEAYKEHPELGNPSGKARKRIRDLRETLLLIRDVHQEAKENWLRGNRSQYELEEEWREKLLKRLNP